MSELTVKEVAEKLKVSDKAIYKRISNGNFKKEFTTKVGGKTLITEEGFNYLSSVVKKKKVEIEGELALTLDSNSTEIDIDENEMFYVEKVYTAQELDIIKMLKAELEFLKAQLEQQQDRFQEQLKIQSENNLKVQLETIKSKDAIISNLHDVIKSEQDTSKKIIDYDQRSREIDDKLGKLRQELIERKEKEEKKKKRVFSFLGK